MRTTLRSAMFSVLLLLAPHVALAETSALRGGSRGLLWKVEGKGGKAYVLARIHVLSANTYPLHPRIRTAFDASEVLALEMNLTDPAIIEHAKKAYKQAGTYPRGDSLPQHVSPETYRAVQEAMKFLAVDVHEVDHARPWLASEVLLEMGLRRAKFDPKNILEGPFFKMAAQGQKEIVEIVPIDEQIKSYETCPPDKFEQLLRLSAQEAPNLADELKRKEDAWKLGDASAWTASEDERLQRHPEAKAAVEFLRARRAKIATSYVADFVDSGRTHFVILDAGTLLGSQGLFEQLKARGYTVTSQ